MMNIHETGMSLCERRWMEVELKDIDVKDSDHLEDRPARDVRDLMYEKYDPCDNRRGKNVKKSSIQAEYI